MSNFGPLPGQPTGRVPVPPRGEPIARYGTYLEAQRAVDYLSDNHFPVQFVTIVGTGLQMVERVTGRLTYTRMAVAGALSGLWFGLCVGLVLSFFGGTNGALLAAPLLGAAFGVMYGVISYALTGGRRDFSSTSQIVAGEYAVLCLAEQAGAARQLLRNLPGGTGTMSWPAAPAGAWPTAQPGAPVGYGGYGAGPGEPPAPPAPPVPDEPGLTYGEAIERQKRAERERRERAAAAPPGEGDRPA